MMVFKHFLSKVFEQFSNRMTKLVEKVFERVNQDQSIKEYGLTALLKLYTKFFSQSGLIMDLITRQTKSTDSEVQKRACEYLELLEPQWDDYRAAICETIPEYEGITNENLTQKPIGDVNLQQMSVEPEKQTVQENQIQEGGAPDIDDLLGGGEMITTTNNNNIQNDTQNNKNTDLDLMDLMGPPPQQQNANSSNQNNTANNNDLDILNLYGGSTSNQQQQSNNYGQQQQQQQNQASHNPMDDLFGDFGGSSSQQEQNNSHKITAYSDSNIQILLNCTKNGNVINIDTSFNNNTGNLASDIVFQVAVQKHLKLELNSINQSKIPPNSQGQTHQNMKITNTMQGEKPIAMKVKIGYTMNGQQNGNQVVIKDFPNGW